MSSSEHDRSQDEGQLDSDLERDPGIGQSKGAFAMGGKTAGAEGDNTVEGDVENDPARDGSIPEGHLGRANK